MLGGTAWRASIKASPRPWATCPSGRRRSWRASPKTRYLLRAALHKSASRPRNHIEFQAASQAALDRSTEGPMHFGLSQFTTGDLPFDDFLRVAQISEVSS